MSDKTPPVELTDEFTKSSGIIVLLDALGTRAATIEQAHSYLASLAILQDEVENTLQFHLSSHPKETLEFYKKLSIHFFGDSVLMIYDTVAGQPLHTYLDYLSTILNLLYIEALEVGILFRGALSIGDYIQQKEKQVVLGPAVSDAAAWYDQFDFIGTAATPFATTQIHNAFCECYPEFDKPWEIETSSMLLYPVPLKGGGTHDLFAFNWPGAIGYKASPKGQFLSELQYHQHYCALIKRYPIPFGTERKFANTDLFVKTGCSAWHSAQSLLATSAPRPKSE